MASAHLIERHAGVVDLSVRSRAGIQSYQLGSAVSLDAAYAGTTLLFTVPRDHTFRSPTLQRNRINLVGETSRGLTRMSYDPVDYASATVPGDPDISFVRIAEVDSTGTVLPEGPIAVIPPPTFFVAGRAQLNLNGTAPDVAGLANNLPPADAMWVDLPKFANGVIVYNDGGSDLMVSFGPGTQEIAVSTGLTEPVYFNEVGTSLISFRGNGGATAFRALISEVNGLLA